MLYRIDLMAAKGEDDFQAACDMEEWLSKHGVLVPVEPCEHGNYARHIINMRDSLIGYQWCVGAALGKEGT